MNTVSHRIGKSTFIFAVFAAAVLVFAALASIAAASPGFNELCSDCHSSGIAAPTVTTTTAGGTTTYTVGNSSVGWAAFDLSTSTTGSAVIGGGNESSGGTFTAPAADYVRVIDADGFSSGTWTNGYLLKPTVTGGNGTISPATAQVVGAGGGTTFTITPNSGYKIASVTVNGTANADAVTAGSYTFSNVQADGTISATFASNVATYAITATAGTGGTISPSGSVSVNSGDNKTFTVTPNAGYKVASFKVDDVAAQLTNNSYTFTNVTKAHTIAVTFAASVQKTTATLSLSGLKSGAIKHGKTLTCKGTIKPARSGKATITLQRKSGSKWVKVTAKTATINATSGAYTCAYKPTKTGSWRVQTTVAKTNAFAAVTTSWKTFKVK